ncbi:hypothetical protein [Nocardioides sp. URHA0020]|uniref:hypothetical protein n=1 Tax=Nocardioides sp. URHA0020 TaxID=1380392 RepID=UPI00048BB7BA|nr:hypothetical protein [Nocardioides sp. URHA0020]
MIDDPTLDQQLRELDAAPLDDEVDRDRQDRLLASVLASDPDLPVVVTPSRARRPARRVAWGAAAAVVTTAAVVLPLTSGGQPAFASWTEVPVTASEHDGRALRSACLDQVGDAVGGDGAPRVASGDLRTGLVDRRGDWVSVLLTWTGPDRYGFSVACLGHLPPGSTEKPTDVTHTVAGGGGWRAPEGHELVEGPMSELSVGGGILGLGRSEEAATTNGEVGPDVVAVTIHAGPTTVEASVDHGTYAAWWPGTIAGPTPRRTAADDGGPGRILRYDITLRDGTLLRDVAPVHPTR